MTSLPDWLVERAALDEVPSASRDRIDRADPHELAERVAKLREDNAAELAKHPVEPAVAQIEARVAADVRRRMEQRRRRLRAFGLASGALAAAVLVLAVTRTTTTEQPVDVPLPGDGSDGIRVKGPLRLLAFRQAGDHPEKLEQDALVREGDLIQLRYNAGGHSHGLIASVDGAGAVTLHYPSSEDAPPEATAVPSDTKSLPNAYALDDAPHFERFFIIAANAPIDVQQSLAALRAFARRPDSATASLDLPAGLRQWSLRLRKPDNSNRSPTP